MRPGWKFGPFGNKTPKPKHKYQSLTQESSSLFYFFIESVNAGVTQAAIYLYSDQILKSRLAMKPKEAERSSSLSKYPLSGSDNKLKKTNHASDSLRN